MDTMVPVFGATDVYSVTGREDDAPGFAGNWSITATALCAQPPAGWEHAEMTGVDLISDTQVRMTAAEDEDGFAGNWAPRAYAICA
ncbi:hypothetical protein GA0074694_2015 [Micromonospora inyonensis]|uniref:Uncharacterized protein n=2 Tax=Micromonospora inyonensis TaxID=47866 RepID=A0A1C6RJV1_9ACTN|nr:hypothetical protein GA0074694_2015 [Micromonospora inyonensis]